MSFMSPQRLDLRIRVIHDWDMGLGPAPIKVEVRVPCPSHEGGTMGNQDVAYSDHRVMLAVAVGR